MVSSTICSTLQNKCLCYTVKPGTVIDNHITHPIDFDFFLVAHASPMGTARPTHYHVIHDENKFTAAQLQQLTHDMCYCYARATKAVSLIPVVYYAHLVGNRVKAYCGSGPGSGSSSIGSSSTIARALLPGIDSKIRTAMWYV